MTQRLLLQVLGVVGATAAIGFGLAFLTQPRSQPRESRTAADVNPLTEDPESPAGTAAASASPKPGSAEIDGVGDDQSPRATGVQAPVKSSAVIAPNMRVDAALAALSTEALASLIRHCELLRNSGLMSEGVQDTLRRSDLVFSLMPQFSQLVADGRIQAKATADPSQVAAPTCTFTLDVDKPMLWLNIHGATAGVAYGIPRSVGSDELWSAILGPYGAPDARRDRGR